MESPFIEDTDDEKYVYPVAREKSYLTLRSEKRDPPSLDLWSRISLEAGSNNDLLASEMWGTLRGLTGFMRGLELAAKERRIKRLTNTTGDWTRFCEGEERFASSLEAGKRTMASLWKALRLGSAQHTKIKPTQLYSRIIKFEKFAEESGDQEKIEELSLCLKELIGRFAQICETEGVDHNLPVMVPPDVPQAVAALPKMKKRVPNFQIPSQEAHSVKKETESHNIVYDFGDQIESDNPIEDPGVLLPVGFVFEYCRRDRSTPIYEDMGTVGRSAVNQEYVVVCKVGSMSGEGRARKKSAAKQCAAAMFIKCLLRKQKKDRLPDSVRHLSLQERLLAVRAMSEVLEFEKELEKISAEDYHRMPIYTPLVNSCGNHIRCKALGYNAVGYGRSREVAKRMAAKLILDMYLDSKELAKKKSKLKFEATKNAAALVK